MITKTEWLRLQTNSARIMHNAIRHGYLPKIDSKTKCVDCGEPAYGYDHRDYRKPLDVSPVCRKCNAKRGHALPEFEDDLLSRGSFLKKDEECAIECYDNIKLHIEFDENEYDQYISWVSKNDFNYEVMIADNELRKYPKRYKAINARQKAARRRWDKRRQKKIENSLKEFGEF